jgi:hypothetical protein
MKARSRWKAPAASASVVSLIAVAALVPGAQGAGTVHRCGNKPVTLEIDSGEAKPEIVKTTIKDITAQGLTCSAAYKFLGLLFHNKTSTTPEHFKCTTGHFKVPIGYVPQVCTHKGTKVTYAAQGG